MSKLFLSKRLESISTLRTTLLPLVGWLVVRLGLLLQGTRELPVSHDSPLFLGWLAGPAACLSLSLVGSLARSSGFVLCASVYCNTSPLLPIPFLCSFFFFYFTPSSLLPLRNCGLNSLLLPSSVLPYCAIQPRREKKEVKRSIGSGTVSWSSSTRLLSPPSFVRLPVRRRVTQEGREEEGGGEEGKGIQTQQRLSTLSGGCWTKPKISDSQQAQRHKCKTQDVL